MVSVFGNIKEEHFRTEPYFHACTTQALAPAYFNELAANFPDVSRIRPESWGNNNTLILLSTLETLKDGILAPVWREFIEYHHSPAFFQEAVGLFGSQIRELYPDLESRLGKPLERLTVAPRKTGVDADVLVECQFAVNTPVRTPTRVRGFHVDDPRKIFNSLLYMRLDEDDSEGGDFQIGRYRDQPRLQVATAPDDAVEVVNQVQYQSNTMIFMINSPFALHGVSPRMPTPHPRRYINILAEFRGPIFDLRPYQDEKTPWALMVR